MFAVAEKGIWDETASFLGPPPVCGSTFSTVADHTASVPTPLGGSVVQKEVLLYSLPPAPISDDPGFRSLGLLSHFQLSILPCGF